MEWDPAKNEKLKRERGVSFEEILQFTFVGIVPHLSRRRQMVLLFEREGLVWVVPCTVTGGAVFLKTLFPSRKYTKKWRRGEIH